MATRSADRKRELRSTGRRGRRLFQLGRPVLLSASWALARLPRPVAAATLGLCRGLPGYPGLAIRYVCVKRLAAACGDNVAIHPGVYLSDLDGLSLGSNIKIGEMCFIGAAGGVVIESDVSVAHASTILTEEHDYTEPGPLRDTPLIFKPVTVRRGVWIGAGVKVTAGVEIGEETAIGAGAVVTRDVPPRSVAAGVPARVLRSRSEDTP
jgi:acetyltransferase-like isoleucine patch superfamily enzyme